MAAQRLPRQKMFPSPYEHLKKYNTTTLEWIKLQTNVMNAQYLKIYLWSYSEPNLLFVVMLQFLRWWRGEGNMG